MGNVNTKKIKEISNMVINNIENNRIDIHKLLESLESKYIHIHVKFGYLSFPTTTKSPKFDIIIEPIFVININITNYIAKKIGLYPWHKYTYTVKLLKYYRRKSNKPLNVDKLRNQKDYLVRTKITFVMQKSKSQKRRKKFELFRFLTFLYRLDPMYILKIEKELLNVS